MKGYNEQPMSLGPVTIESFEIDLVAYTYNEDDESESSELESDDNDYAAENATAANATEAEAPAPGPNDGARRLLLQDSKTNSGGIEEDGNATYSNKTTAMNDGMNSTAGNSTAAVKSPIHIAGILSGFIAVELSEAKLGHPALRGLAPEQVPGLGEGTLTARVTFSFDSRTNAFAVSAEIRYEDDCVLVILQAAASTQCGEGQVQSVMGTINLKSECNLEGSGKVSGTKYCGDGEEAAGYELHANILFLKYTISDDAALEVEDSHIKLLVGAGLPDDVLDSWEPDEGHETPDSSADDGEEETLDVDGALTSSQAKLAHAKRVRKQRLGGLAKLGGSMKDKLPTTLSLQGKAKFRSGGNGSAGGPSIPKVDASIFANVDALWGGGKSFTVKSAKLAVEFAVSSAPASNETIAPMIMVNGIAEYEYPCELGGQIGAEVNTTVNLPNFQIPVIVANVTFFCGVELGEPTLLILIYVPEPIGPIHGMKIADVEVSAEATYWGEAPEDGKRWTFIGTIQGTVVTASEDEAGGGDDVSASMSVTFIFDTKTGDIELTVDASLSWDDFKMELAAQIATGDSCDQVHGNYIRGNFGVIFSKDVAENNEITNETMHEQIDAESESAPMYLSGVISGVVHCDGHHEVAVQRRDIEPVEIGRYTRNILDKVPSGSDSGVLQDLASVDFVKNLISYANKALPKYPKYQFKASINGEMSPGFSVGGSFVVYSGGGTIVQRGAETTKPIFEQDHWIGEIYGKIIVGDPAGPGKSMIDDWPIDKISASVGAMVHICRAGGWNLGGVFDLSIKKDTADYTLQGGVQVPFAYHGCDLPMPQEVEIDDYDDSDTTYYDDLNTTHANTTETDHAGDVDGAMAPAPGPSSVGLHGTNETEPFHGQDFGVDKVSVSLSLVLKKLGDGPDGLQFTVLGDLYMKPTPDNYLVAALSGTLDEELEIGIVTLAFIEVSVGLHSFNGSKWVTGNVTGEVAVNPLGNTQTNENEKRTITELVIELSVFFDTSIGTWSFVAEGSFVKGRPGDLWLEIGLIGTAESSNGGSCPDSGWQFGASAAIELEDAFGFEAEGEGLYHCDPDTMADAGFQWAFEFNLYHIEIQLGSVKIGLYEVNVTVYGNPVGGTTKKTMEWFGSFNATVELEAQFKGAPDLMVSASIESDYRRAENTTQFNSTITLEFEVNAWPVELEVNAEAASLGVRQNKPNKKNAPEYHMSLKGMYRGGHSCEAPTQAGVIGAPRTLQIELNLRKVYGVDIDARGTLIMYCENGESPDGQMWTLVIEVGDANVNVVDVSDAATLDYMDTDRTFMSDDASAIDDAKRTKKQSLKELDENKNQRVEWEEFQKYFATEFKGGRRSEKLRAKFDSFDKDGSDSLDKKEINADLVALMDAKDATTEVFEWIDTDGDKQLSYDEMDAYLWDQKGFKGKKGFEALKRRFIEMDGGESWEKVYNRYLDREEFKQFADKYPVSDKRDEVMSKLDTDESGDVERDEYRRFVEGKHDWSSDEWAPVFEKFDVDKSNSLDREEMYALLEEDDIVRAAHVAQFQPRFEYNGQPIDAGALVTIDGYKNETDNKTQLAGVVLIKVGGVDSSFTFDRRNGGSFSIAASKIWEWDWGTMSVYGSWSDVDCDDNKPADEIKLKTSLAGKLTLTEFKAASLGFSGKYYCLGGHAGKKWEIAANVKEIILLREPKRLKLNEVIFSTYAWKDPSENNTEYFISFAGLLTLGGASETVLGGGELEAQVEYQVGAAAKNLTLYERLRVNVTGRVDIVAGDLDKVVKVSGDIDIQIPCPENAIFAGTASVVIDLTYGADIEDQAYGSNADARELIRNERYEGSMRGKSNGVRVPGAEGSAKFFCPGLVARVPTNYFEVQLKGILATNKRNDLDDDGNYKKDSNRPPKIDTGDKTEEEFWGGNTEGEGEMDAKSSDTRQLYNSTTTDSATAPVDLESVNMDTPECEGGAATTQMLTEKNAKIKKEEKIFIKSEPSQQTQSDYSLISPSVFLFFFSSPPLSPSSS